MLQTPLLCFIYFQPTLYWPLGQTVTTQVYHSAPTIDYSAKRIGQRVSHLTVKTDCNTVNGYEMNLQLQTIE